MKQRRSLGYFVIALAFTCTPAFTAVAQNPHAAYPTYVGKVSPHHPSHIRKARSITSLQPSGFDILADMGSITPVLMDGNLERSIFTTSLAAAYKITFLQHFSLSVGVGARLIISSLLVTPQVCLAYQPHSVNFQLAWEHAAIEGDYSLVYFGFSKGLGLRVGLLQWNNHSLSAFYTLTATIPIRPAH
ncbi:MAG: hypothetical protein MJZ86_04990 [Bacteroidales bacterium]|nr:hypothetical protein [Bacteroidales bacterium]